MSSQALRDSALCLCHCFCVLCSVSSAARLCAVCEQTRPACSEYGARDREPRCTRRSPRARLASAAPSGRRRSVTGGTASRCSHRPAAPFARVCSARRCEGHAGCVACGWPSRACEGASYNPLERSSRAECDNGLLTTKMREPKLKFHRAQVMRGQGARRRGTGCAACSYARQIKTSG